MITYEKKKITKIYISNSNQSCYDQMMVDLKANKKWHVLTASYITSKSSALKLKVTYKIEKEPEIKSYWEQSKEAEEKFFNTPKIKSKKNKK